MFMALLSKLPKVCCCYHLLHFFGLISFKRCTLVPHTHQDESVSKSVERLKVLCIVDGNVKWCVHCGKQNGGSSKN